MSAPNKKPANGEKAGTPGDRSPHQQKEQQQNQKTNERLKDEKAHEKDDNDQSASSA